MHLLKMNTGLMPSIFCFCIIIWLLGGVEAIFLCKDLFFVILWLDNVYVSISICMEWYGNKERAVKRKTASFHLYFHVKSMPACHMKCKSFLQWCPLHHRPTYDNTLSGVTAWEALTCQPLIIFTTGSLDSLHSSAVLQNNPFRAECHCT